MEVWDVYDKDRNLTGRTHVRGEKLSPGDYHLVVSAYFIRPDGKILIQRRADCKDSLPGIWSETGGAAIQGENSRQAVLREVQEELGFTPDLQKGQVLLSVSSDEQNYFDDVYLFRQDIPPEAITCQASEVAEVKWVDPEEILNDETLRHDFTFLPRWPLLAPALRAESARYKIPTGAYRHFKGGSYEVLGISIHSETLEPMVIYRANYGTHETWVRPARMWNENVVSDGKTVPRFCKV